MTEETRQEIGTINDKVAQLQNEIYSLKNKRCELLSHEDFTGRYFTESPNTTIYKVLKKVRGVFGGEGYNVIRSTLLDHDKAIVMQLEFTSQGRFYDLKEIDEDTYNKLYSEYNKRLYDKGND